MSNIIQSLWIGKPLSKLEQLSIKSFIDNGHENIYMFMIIYKIYLKELLLKMQMKY